MGKNIVILSLVQAILAIMTGVLSSKMSFIGRLGINLFYKQYRGLKSEWRTAIVVLLIQLALILILTLFKYFSKTIISGIAAAVFLIIGGAGTYLTYVDFTTTSHRFMKSNFHLGGYLFWVAWGITCLFFIIIVKKEHVESEQIL